MSKRDNFIIELGLNYSLHQHAILEKRFAIGEKIYNKTLKHARKQLKKMKENKEYKKALNTYLLAKKASDKEKIKQYSDVLTAIVRSYSLSEYDFHKFVKVQQNMYKKILIVLLLKR